MIFDGERDIGAAAVDALSAMGAQIAFSYYGSDPHPLLNRIENRRCKVIACKVDAIDTGAVRRFVRDISDETGKKIDVLVNTVGGIVGRKTMVELDNTFWDYVFALNVKSDFAATQAAILLMNDGGSIINVSSQAGRDGGGPGAIVFSSSKGALMPMTRGLAKELGPRQIRVNAVFPGMISTRFHDDFTKPDVRMRVANMTPLGREGKANEVGNLIAYLASDRSS